MDGSQVDSSQNNLNSGQPAEQSSAVPAPSAPEPVQKPVAPNASTAGEPAPLLSEPPVISTPEPVKSAYVDRPLYVRAGIGPVKIEIDWLQEKLTQREARVKTDSPLVKQARNWWAQVNPMPVFAKILKEDVQKTTLPGWEKTKWSGGQSLDALQQIQQTLKQNWRLESTMRHKPTPEEIEESNGLDDIFPETVEALSLEGDAPELAHIPDQTAVKSDVALLNEPKKLSDVQSQASVEPLIDAAVQTENTEPAPVVPQPQMVRPRFSFETVGTVASLKPTSHDASLVITPSEQPPVIAGIAQPEMAPSTERTSQAASQVVSERSQQTSVAEVVEKPETQPVIRDEVTSLPMLHAQAAPPLSQTRASETRRPAVEVKHASSSDQRSQCNATQPDFSDINYTLPGMPFFPEAKHSLMAMAWQFFKEKLAPSSTVRDILANADVVDIDDYFVLEPVSVSQSEHPSSSKQSETCSGGGHSQATETVLQESTKSEIEPPLSSEVQLEEYIIKPTPTKKRSAMLTLSDLDLKAMSQAVVAALISLEQRLQEQRLSPPVKPVNVRTTIDPDTDTAKSFRGGSDASNQTSHAEMMRSGHSFITRVEITPLTEAERQDFTFQSMLQNNHILGKSILSLADRYFSKAAQEELEREGFLY